jgi:hypothetical protein
MSGVAGDLAMIAARSSWRLAWLAVWSPLAAWIGSIAALVSLRFFGVGAVAAGLAVALCGLVGLFVVVPGALDSLNAARNTPGMTSRERARLEWLSLVGVLFSLLGYGCLLVPAGFVVMLSPFEGIQH